MFFPWVFALLILLPTFLELDPAFGAFGYNPTTGECNIINDKVFSVIEILGTYVPFSCMVASYTFVGSRIWESDKNDKDNRYIFKAKRFR